MEDDVVFEDEEVVEFVFPGLADQLELGLMAAPATRACFPPDGQLSLMSVDGVEPGDVGVLGESAFLEMGAEPEAALASGGEGDDGDAFEVVGEHDGEFSVCRGCGLRCRRGAF